MKIHYANEHGCNFTITENDAYLWAHRPGAAWPCSTIHRSVFVSLDRQGDLVDTNAGDEVDARELTALISDLLADAVAQKWRSREQCNWLNYYATTQAERV